jgi:thiamine biosynthesis lipoprotein ApbE
MKRSSIRPVARAFPVVLALGIPLLAVTPEPAQTRVLRHENVLGTSMELRVRSRDASVAGRAEAVALGEIDRLARVFSTYSPHSEFSRWQASTVEALPVSAELFAVMDLADHWRVATDGAFHPGAALLGRMWREASAAGREPDPSALAEGVRRLAVVPWMLDREARVARRVGGYPVTLDAIAKGWIIEKASERAWQLGGMESLVLEVGGDLRVRGTLPEPVAIVDPRNDDENAPAMTWVDVRDAGLATSGGYRRHSGMRGGRPSSHILDPRTGRPSEVLLGATVVAPDAATADALATAFNVLEPDASVRLANSTPGVACPVAVELANRG